MARKAVRPKDARLRDGQYFTNIAPNTMSLEDLSRTLYNNPGQIDRLKYYIAIDVTGLPLASDPKKYPNIYAVLNDKPLSIKERLVGAGSISGFKP
ncbi:HYD1 signature containing ADP-ribosyltransferase family protein [Brevibacillus sp. B_LB10_24]|uniref:HYD1 signature containing ADP-ribosyltransferase family protein n=1 Tax=Brevibacillus sp. B_LB10_24 TaxID=3380645 RepID=UPI0038BA4879